MEKDKVKVVLMAGSAGSLEVLVELLPGLKAPIPFAFVIVLHRKAGEDSLLEDLIALKATVPVKETEDKVSLMPGNIYVAPSDYHLLFEKDGSLSLDTSDKVNYSRPSIDVSFESAADVYGSNLAAVLLSGANADGAIGLKAVQGNGGIAIIQDPATAEMPFMPKSALALIQPDHSFTPQELLSFLNSL